MLLWLTAPAILTWLGRGWCFMGFIPKQNLKVKLKPVLSLKTKVMYVKKVPKGVG